MFPIINYPVGLQTQLGLQDGGRGPQQLSEQLVSTLDLTDQYLLNNREYVPLTGQIAAVPGVAFPEVVPPGQLWYVWGISMAVTTSAVQTITYAPHVLIDGNPIELRIADYLALPISTSGRSRAPEPFWLKSGSQFVVGIQAQTGGPTVQCALVITRLRV